MDYKKTSLERRLSSRRYSSFSPYQTNKRNTSIQGTAIPPSNFSPTAIDNNVYLFNSPNFIKKLGSPITPCLDTPVFCKDLTSFSFPKMPEDNSTTPNFVSNVQDHSYDEDLSFEAQMEAGKNTPNQHVSLRAELIQVKC